MKDKEKIKNELIEALERQIKNVTSDNSLDYVLEDSIINVLASILELNVVKLR